MFYLYTHLTTDNSTADNSTADDSAAVIKETEIPSSQTETKVNEYAQFVQLLSKRELEVIEAILAGNVRHKQLSAALNISVNTIKTH